MAIATPSLEVISFHFFFVIFIPVRIILVCIIYFLDPAGPAARIDEDNRGGERQERRESREQVEIIDYRNFSTRVLLRQSCRDGLIVVLYFLELGWVYGEEEDDEEAGEVGEEEEDEEAGEEDGNEEAGEGEGNEEVEQDPSQWMVLKGRMVDELRVRHAQLEAPLEWWSRNWKGFLLLLGLAILWSFVFDPDLSEPEDDLAEGNQTIADGKIPEMVPITYTYDGTRAAADATAMVVANRVAPEAGLAWETPFVGTLEDPLYSREIWSNEDWASAWATGMMDAVMGGEPSNSQSAAAEVCSLLIRRCRAYPEDWESCRLEPIARSAQTLERCMDFASRERRRMRERLLSRSVESAVSWSIPSATSASMTAIDRIKASLITLGLPPMSTRAIDRFEALLDSSRLEATSMRAVDRVEASFASSSLATKSIHSSLPSARLTITSCLFTPLNSTT